MMQPVIEVEGKKPDARKLPGALMRADANIPPNPALGLAGNVADQVLPPTGSSDIVRGQEVCSYTGARAADEIDTMTGNRSPSSIEVPGYEGRAVCVCAGELIRVTDVRGTQIGDVFALSESNPEEYLSTAETRSVTWRLFPEVGGRFYTNLRRPILKFVEDHSPGIHDMLFSACDQPMFEELGFVGAHANCRDNYLNAVAELGAPLNVVPDPVNIFQNTPLDSEGRLSSEVTPSKPGDYICFRAEMDLIFVLTACSVDIGINLPNGGRSTPLRIEILTGTAHHSKSVRS